MKKILTALLCWLPLLAPLPASACKLAEEAYDLNALLKSKDENTVVFRATVTAVTALPATPEFTSQEIRFDTSQWWRGKPEKEVRALASRRLRATHDCSMIHNFSVRKGEEWLIVGSLEEGKVRPSALMSVLLKDGKLAPDVEEILQQNH